MINETFKNVFFAISNILLLLVSLKQSGYVANHSESAEKLYGGLLFGSVITLLFVNFCLFIFAMFILMNLNDFILKRCLNLIGAHQKLRIVGALVVI